jgi:hypothetical protein
LRTPKSANTEPSTVVTSRSTTPPSTVPSAAAISDDESEPFVVCQKNFLESIIEIFI